ncbi:formate/nitrite transporter family protein [Halorubrum sodomense]|uniref:Formate/nitrite transporter FocA, FNT family n=1 Tax=Halorubrum sodomense TaxID=35743 RepID=A0A1I6FM74_HALSD|nr:formate/nitrite transporter family protein [Halorubrum sodomense]SFR31030.1 Formate/nitrite transporter FocA, FNT family [Halorubrum sodomense]
MTDSERPDDDSMREVVERSRSGAPAVGEAVRDRFSSDEVFQRIIAAADEEVTSGSRELFFSGLAAGLAITITFMLYASLTASTDSHPVLSVLLYPLGFIYIIIGGYQLYTENTLPPVALTLERLASIPTLLRHWTIVLAGNFTGGAIGAAVLSYGGVFTGDTVGAARYISRGGFDVGAVPLFFKAAMAGLIVAGVVWVGFASTDSVSRMLVVYLAFLAIPLGDLFHVVVSFTEVLYLFFEYSIPLYGAEISLYSGLVGFVIPVLLGNTIGGVVLVTLVNYFQTSEERLEEARFEGVTRRLTVPEWAFGRAAGRSYVPILDATEAGLFAGEGYRIMVPITNPRTDGPIVELGARLASSHEEGVVHIVHVVQAPERMSLSSGDAGRRIADVSAEGMADLRSTATEYDVEVATSTVVSHRSFEEVFDAARRTRPDAVLMGWGDDQLWGAARAERPIDELTNQLPCDFLILNEHELDTSRVLIPTSGGPDSDLSAEVAKVLADTAGAEVTLLHVVDGPEKRPGGEAFLAAWADEHGLDDAELVVDEGGDVEAGIARAAADETLIIIGATEKGLLSRLVSNSLHLDVIHDVDASVLLTERPSARSLRERLFGSGRRATDMSAGVDRDAELSQGTDVGSAERRESDRDAGDDTDGEEVADDDTDGTAAAGDEGVDAGGSTDERPPPDDSYIADHDDADEEAAGGADPEDTVGEGDGR